MRTLLSALLLTTAIPAFADTISLNTDVTAALITGQGGVVTYSAVATLPAGRHTLIAHLPDSRYGEGPLDINFADATGIRILSQTTATQFAEPLHRDEPAALQAAIKALDTAKATLRRFEETVETKRAEQTAAELQLQLMHVTAKNGLGDSDTGVQADQLAAIAATIAQTTRTAQATVAKVKTELAAMEPERKALTRAFTRAQRLVDSLKPDRLSNTVQISTQIEVTTAQDATINFDNLEQIYWQPQYAADLTQTKTKGTFDLHRSARVMVGQPGVEPLDPWDNVTITLSTANLNDRTNTHIPWPQLKQLVDEMKLRKSRVSSGASYESEAPRAEPVVAVMDAASGTSFSGQTVLFNLGSGHSIDWRSNSNTFAIDTLNMSVDLYAMANAAQDANAFLYTDLKNETGGVLLAGDIQLTRDGTPVGTTTLPQLSPGQTEPIGLGPLYGIRLQRDILSVEQGDSGFITTNSEINRSYRTAITSALSYDIPMKLLDVIPTSEDEDLVIRMESRPRPTEENRDGKRGVLVWALDLKAGTTEEIRFGYQMKWPKDKIPVDR